MSHATSSPAPSGDAAVPAVDPEVIARAQVLLSEQLTHSELKLAELESSLSGALTDNDTIQEDRDGLRRVVATIRGEVLEIQSALARIDDGTYGLCITCGRPIAAERLAAIPTVGRCAGCA